MSPELHSILTKVDTPTVCNAIEVAQGKRGFNRFTRGTMIASHPDAPAMVGYARTARIRAVAPPTDAPEIIKARRMAYYQHMATGPRPAVAVVQDLDENDAIGAFWGEVNTNIHKSFGLSGTLTNGIMRDLGDLPDGYPVVAGSVGPSHGFVHVVDFSQPVEIFGLPVSDGDLVHADRHGAVVIPRDIVTELGAAIDTLMRSERIIFDAVKGKTLSFEEFETVWAAFEAART